jgi:hypothetical protein
VRGWYPRRLAGRDATASPLGEIVRYLLIQLRQLGVQVGITDLAGLPCVFEVVQMVGVALPDGVVGGAKADFGFAQTCRNVSNCGGRLSSATTGRGRRRRHVADAVRHLHEVRGVGGEELHQQPRLVGMLRPLGMPTIVPPTRAGPYISG